MDLDFNQCRALYIVSLNTQWVFAVLKIGDFHRAAMRMWSVQHVGQQVQRLMQELGWRMGEVMKAEAAGKAMAEALVETLWPVETQIQEKRRGAPSRLVCNT
jgi:hypothetical protein